MSNSRVIKYPSEKALKSASLENLICVFVVVNLLAIDILKPDIIDAHDVDVVTDSMNDSNRW